MTRLRFDPVDLARPASIMVERLLFLADLAQLEQGEARRVLASRYLDGNGLECGALQNPLAAPPNARVLFIDRLTEKQARSHYPELEGQRLMQPNVVGDLHRLPIADRSLDFCIGNHLLEHARDPIGALQELLRVVRTDGILFVSIPDVLNPLDRHRPVTPFAHLLEDHDPPRDRMAEDLEHYREWVASAHPEMDDAQQRALTERLVAQDYSIHFHTFDEASYRRLLGHACAEAGASVEEFARVSTPDYDEYIAILRRTPSDRPEERAARPRTFPGVDIVVPVYNAREDVTACVESVLRHARGDWRLVLVDDASTDPELAAYLDRVAESHAPVRLLRNAANLGFVRTANRGMRAAGGRDVLLLNSDTIVTAGFLDRLQACAYADHRTGIVSPLSNNATICSVPEIGQANPIPEGSTVDSFGALVAGSSLGLRPEIVTAVGFCMYVRDAVLARVGYFDEENFGRGYGEENDFCQRAIRRGWTNALACDIYVRHVGSVSHPGFFARVASYLAQRPLAPVHENLKLALRRRTAAPGLLMLLHAPFDEPGGGTEHHVRDLLQTAGVPRVVVAVPREDGLELTEVMGGRLDSAVRYRLPLAESPGRFMHERRDIEQAVRKAVRLFGIRAVHIQHLLNWPLSVWRVIESLHVPFALSVHDFYCVCPSLNLIDPRDGRLCCAAVEGSPVDPTTCMRGLFTELALPAPADPAAFVGRHREEFRRIIAAARTVVFPSQSARDLVARFHELDPERVRIVPHGSPTPSRRVGRTRRPGPLRAALIGNIAYPAKGARNYLALLERTRRLPISWHAFGETAVFDFDEELEKVGLGNRLKLHGAYRREELPDLLVASDVDLAVLLPSCPETFSFTLSEALGAGVPVIVGAQGAVAERVRGKAAGVVVETVEAAAAAIEDLVADGEKLRRLREAAALFRDRSLDEMAAEYRDIYERLFRDVPATEPLTIDERRQLFAAYADAAVPRPAPLRTSPLPHYGRWWYPLYLRVASLVPHRLRRWGRDRVVAGWWKPVRRYRFGRPGPRLVASNGIEFIQTTRRGAKYRALTADPFFIFESKPLAPREARVIRFEMRCEARGSLFAQLFWTHSPEEHFSEEKSIQIRVEGHDGGWHEYVVHIDQTGARERWDDGEAIHHLRFDPLNASGTIELRELLLCRT
ncbi:MAG: glycosyltransferase [Deltaproteobacteria bacterium]|nr:MAG: glycosyltransferase [Deltaproteobacteria bacterium]